MERPICYIVGAGENYGLDFEKRPEDLLIAADGGYGAVQEAGLQADLIIGDFDSLGYRPGGEQTVCLPTEKDVTDTWAAIEEGKKRGYKRFWLYGCTGGRIDHTLANFQTVAHLSQEGMEGVLVDQNQIITALTDGTKHFDPEWQGFLSVFAHSDHCRGVTLEGLKYPLREAELTSDFPLGVSNEFLGVPSTVTVQSGTILLVYPRKNLQKVEK